MEIDRKTLEKIMGPLGVGKEAKVSLFVVSSKTTRLKKLALDLDLSPTARAEKLHKWAQQNRFVAVIESGDQVFAHVNSTHLEKLQAIKDLSIEGKKVTVKGLSDEESEQLSAVGEAFKDYILQPSEQNPAEESKALADTQSKVRQYFAHHHLISDQMYMRFVIAFMQNIPGQVILSCLRKEQKEAAERKKEDEKKADIRKQELKKQILKDEILVTEVERQDLQRRVIGEDAARIDQSKKRL